MGVLSDGEQAEEEEGVEVGGDSEQLSFCLQLLNSCTAKVHCIKAQWGGAARQLRSRKRKNKRSLLPAQTRHEKNVSPVNQNNTKRTYATAS